ncbi:MAG: InlB B-repeat-containing protein [Nitrososphaerota archaeon]|nr:InlB B-repeat-containing protein [Nitrososphaerota archaeon]
MSVKINNSTLHSMRRGIFFVSLLTILLFSSLPPKLLLTHAETSIDNTIHVKTETELKNAVNNAAPKTHVTITLDGDITTTERLDITSGKNITLTSNSDTQFFKLAITPLGIGEMTIGIWDGSILEIDGIIVTHTKGAGNGISVASGGTLIFSSGEISGNGAIVGTGGAGVYNEGNFTMSGGVISGNTIGRSAGAGVLNTGNFIMTGGVIIDNAATGGMSRGGGVYNSGGNFTMVDGEISSNTASIDGGGVYNSGGPFKLLGGVISSNTAMQGGGVYNYDNNFTMTNNSLIFNNTAVDGAGVYIRNGVAMLYNGTISNNTASGDGGGIWVAAENLGGLFVFDGMVFSNNRAAVAYDGVLYHVELYRGCIGDNVVWSVPFLQGYNNYDISYTVGVPILFYRVIVENSCAASSGAGVYVAGAVVSLDAGVWAGYIFSGWTITEGDVTIANNSQTTFIMPSGNVSVVANWTMLDSKYKILYELASGTNPLTNPLTYTANDLPLEILSPSKRGYVFTGWTVKYADGTAITMPNSFSILQDTVGDIVLTAHWGRPIYVDNEVTLRVAVNDAVAGVPVIIAFENDIALTMGALIIGAGKTCTLTSDSASEFFKLLGVFDTDTIVVNAGGVLELAGINVTHHRDVEGTGVAIQSGGILIMSNGAISDNTANRRYGGGVYNSGVFSLYGGVISDNKAYSGGGGVFNWLSGSFNVFGGKITGNTAYAGGGVYINSGNFSLFGGEISHNTATSGGGVSNGGSFSMFGGLIFDNTASGGGVFNWGSFSLFGGEISHNTAYNAGGGVANSGSFSLFGGVISDNIASGGGGVYTYGSFSLFGGVISHNSAADGGGLYMGDGVVLLFDGVVMCNIATNNGGGVWVAAENLGGLFVFDGMVFSNNCAAVAYDGEIYHVELYRGCIGDNVVWSVPFLQGYNNYDISYTWGML